jgi:transposase-like protein
MQKEVTEMTLQEFQEQFGTEESCREFLYKKRWPDGFVCPKCGHSEHFNIKARNKYQCKACNHQTTVTAGTVFEKTRTPLTKWFTAIYLVADDKRGCSALALQKKIGVAYFTAWTMLQKIRFAMGDRDGEYMLGGIVEMDEGFFGGTAEGSKRGRGTDKTAVLVSVSLTDGGKPKFARMQTLDAVDGETVKAFSKGRILPGTEIRTDGLAVYNCLAKEGFRHTAVIFDEKKHPAHLHWTHIIISNAKAFVQGTYHGLDKKHLQRYLDEFCYRLNRRYLAHDIFSHLANACALAPPKPYYALIG